MSRSGAVIVTLLVVLAGGCVSRRAAHLPAPDRSGFLDDYSLLHKGEAGELSFVYRNPKANWRAYDKVLLEPVALWRSGRGSLDPVPQEDLLRLASDFEDAVRRRLGEGFRVVAEAEPGTMRIRLAITEARASDPILDILTATPKIAEPHPAGDGPLAPETRRFLEGAAIEGEIRDAKTGELLAEGVDKRRRAGSLEGVIDTWADIDRAFAFWADRVCTRLETRAGRR